MDVKDYIERTPLAETPSSFSDQTVEMGAVQKAENGVLSVALGAFHYKSVDRRQGFIFIRWGRRTVNFWVSAQTLTLNQTLYSQVRETVSNALGNSARSLIAGIRLA